ncbi:MAG TPA: hypothetical protein VJS66_04650 [Burkholderiales bacterium]|nr:hypothetical protein [Burkholderiales bacterium]
MNPNIQSWAWKQRLPRADKRLLFALIGYANDHGFIRHLPVSQLAAKIGCDARSVRQGLGCLIAAQVVQWIDSDCYRLNVGSDSPHPDGRTPPKPVQAKAPIRESVVVYLKTLFR